MEIEAKLLARHAGVLDEIASRRRLGPYRLEAVPAQSLETVYVDTSRRDLGRAGLALRIRKSASGIELTIKEPGTVIREIHRRPEFTVALARLPRFPLRPPRGVLRSRILSASRGLPLVPLLVTRIARRALLVCRPNAQAPVAEIDLDRVEFEIPPGRLRRSAGGRRSFCEVEVELMEGSERDLARIVRELRVKHCLARSLLSKLERGLRWAGLESSGRRGKPPALAGRSRNVSRIRSARRQR